MTSATPGTLNLRPRTLLVIIVGGLLTGTLIVMGAILPVEYQRDPWGLGRLTGLDRLGMAASGSVVAEAAGHTAARSYDVPLRTDVIEIPLTDFLGGARGSELEYKVRMNAAATLVYSWQVVGAGDDDDLRFDFHGHTTPPPGEAMTVASFGDGYAAQAEGALIAPFAGIHGWQFSNSGDQAIVVRLRLSGFYELIEPGQEGNLAGIVANVPAAEARPDFVPGNQTGAVPPGR